MKNYKLNIIFTFLVLVLFSCTKKDYTEKDYECNDVKYNTSFEITIEQKYCFSDGNYFIVDFMRNEFCRCDGICKWEGDMKLGYEAFVDNVEVEKTVGSSLKTNSLFMSEDYYIIFSDIKFEKPCSDSNPSPAITQATVVVRKR